jgi:hypothetical protein
VVDMMASRGRLETTEKESDSILSPSRRRTAPKDDDVEIPLRRKVAPGEKIVRLMRIVVVAGTITRGGKRNVKT